MASCAGRQPPRDRASEPRRPAAPAELTRGGHREYGFHRGDAGLQQRPLYSASKGAVLSLTLAADHIREGIRVNCVSPGTVDTPWVSRLLDSAACPEAERAALNARQPHGRMVDAAEVAGAVAYLASPLSGSTAGTSLAVDGDMQGLGLRPLA